ERRLDALAELLVHCAFFAAPIGRAAQHKPFATFLTIEELHLHAVTQLVPALRLRQCLTALLEVRLRCTDDVAAPRITQPGKVLPARHAAVRDPHPPHRAVPLLHRLDDLLQGRRIVSVARKNLITQGESVEGYDQRDTHLLAVWPVITGV